jgi:hypothetical protein
MTAAPQLPAPISIPCGDATTWASPLDLQELSRHIAACKADGISSTEKGARLERLLCWLLSHVPGVRVVRHNLFAADRSQEIDILAWNERHPSGFNFMGEKIIAECKNWDHPVDSKDVAWFAWKMRLGGVTDGILVAANGITTNASRRGAAVEIVLRSNSDEPARTIYVVRLDELATLASADALRSLIVDKSIALTGLNPFG